MVHLFERALRRATPLLFGAALGAGFLFGRVSTAQGQSGSLAGTVVASKSGRPLPDATIAAEGTVILARTNTRGEFQLNGLAGPSVRIRVTRIGYQPLTQDAALGGGPVHIELTELVVHLDELVVTGTPGEVQERSLGNVIGRVNVADNVVVAPPAKLQDMLSVNVPGVRIIRASGAIGSGGTTRIRGSGSLSLGNAPLIYIDGVRVNNQDAAVSEAFFGAQEAPSRINDLNPEEIESVEILKGPSAATIYGTEASNGVIQIITKRGRQGRPTFDVHADAGANWLMNPEGRYQPSYYISRVDGQVHPFDVLEFNEQRGYGSPFSTGKRGAMGASLSGGTNQVRYYVSVDGNRDEGYVTYNWQNKWNGRANVTYSSSDAKFKFDLSLGAVHSKLRGASGFQPITASILWPCVFPLWCEPDYSNGGRDSSTTGWNGPGHGYTFYRPEDYQHVFGYDNLDRTTASVRFSHNPFPWLRHHLTIGPDYTNDHSSDLIERDATGYHPFRVFSDGFKSSAERRSTFFTADYGASTDWNIGKGITATTSAGVQYYHKQFDNLLATGSGFVISGSSDITGAVQRQADERFVENKTLGVYGQEQLAFKNRVFLTAALRGDGNSAFGKNFNAVYYPKLSVSWVASEEPFLANQRWLSQLKLRGAWGRAGQQPDVSSAIQTYLAKVGPHGIGGVTPKNFGNPDLKPEIGQELEAGFDAAILEQRVGIEFTYYDKRIRDAIFSVPVRPSRGFPGIKFVNIGETLNRGVELAVDLTPFRSRSMGLDLRLTFATNESRITNMGGTEPTFVGRDAQQFNVQGFAPASFFYQRVVGSTITKALLGDIEIPLGSDPMCEGGTDLGRGDGTTVPCAGAPRLSAGRPTPKWNGSLGATLTVAKHLRVLALVDYLGGNTVLVGDVAAVHGFFLSSRQVLEGKDPILSGYLGTLYLSQGDPNTVWATGLFKGGFAKLRTVSLSYEFSRQLARSLGAARGSITASAENLAILWREQRNSFGVPWIDPEIVPNGAFDPTGNLGYSQESWPQAARIRTTIRLTF